MDAVTPRAPSRQRWKLLLHILHKGLSLQLTKSIGRVKFQDHLVMSPAVPSRPLSECVHITFGSQRTGNTQEQRPELVMGVVLPRFAQSLAHYPTQYFANKLNMWRLRVCWPLAPEPPHANNGETPFNHDVHFIRRGGQKSTCALTASTAQNSH